jgi:hypothetical protein
MDGQRLDNKMKCFECLSRDVCRFNNSSSDFYKGYCPYFHSRFLAWIRPHCEKCGAPLSLEVHQYRVVNNLIRIATEFTPNQCPECHMLIDKLEIDYENHTCIAKEYKACLRR